MPKLLNPTDQEYKITVKSKEHPVNEDDPIIVSFSQATEVLNLKRQDMLSNPVTRQWLAEDYKEESKPITFSKRKAIDVFLTLRSCNITDANDQPIFAFRNGKLLDKTLEEFIFKWGKLWPEWTDAIWLKCIKTNPSWGLIPEEPEVEAEDSLPLVQSEPKELESE